MNLPATKQRSIIGAMRKHAANSGKLTTNSNNADKLYTIMQNSSNSLSLFFFSTIVNSSIIQNRMSNTTLYKSKCKKCIKTCYVDSWQSEAAAPVRQHGVIP